MQGTFTYIVAKVGTEALHWVRWRIGDTEESKHNIEDEEVTAALLDRALTATSNPITNAVAVRLAAADCCRAIAGRLASVSEVAITDVGPVKSNAADLYLKLAKILESEVSVSTGGPLFANPEAYSTTHVVGVDADPAEE